MAEPTKESAQPDTAQQQNINAAPQQTAAPQNTGLRGLLGGNKDKISGGGSNKATEPKEEKSSKPPKTAQQQPAATKAETEKPAKEDAPSSQGADTQQEEERAKSADTAIPAVQVAARKENFSNLRKLLNDKCPSAFKEKISLTQWQAICPSNLEGKEQAQAAILAAISAMQNYDQSDIYQNKLSACDQLAAEASKASSLVGRLLSQLNNRPAANQAMQAFAQGLSNLNAQANKQKELLKDGFEAVFSASDAEELVDDKQLMSFLHKQGQAFKAEDSLAFLTAYSKKSMKSEEMFYAFVVSKKLVDKTKEGKQPKGDRVDFPQGIFNDLWEQFQKTPDKIDFEKAFKAMSSKLAKEVLATKAKAFAEKNPLG